MRRIFQTLAVMALVAATGSAANAAERPANPFRKAGAAPAETKPATDADLEALQLSGISMIGGERLFNLVDSRTQRSFWIPLRGTENGFTLARYDDEADEVVVKRGSFSRTIALRKPVLIAAAPAAPPASGNTRTASDMPPLEQLPKEGVSEIKDPKTPDEIKQAEFEARMMVSDLLEISMRERERQRAIREGRQPAQN